MERENYAPAALMPLAALRRLTCIHAYRLPVLASNGRNGASLLTTPAFPTTSHYCLLKRRQSRAAFALSLLLLLRTPRMPRPVPSAAGARLV